MVDFGNEIFTINLFDEKNKQKGKLNISKFDCSAHATFLDLYMKSSINIVPVLAVDFSLSNLTFDGSN